MLSHILFFAASAFAQRSEPIVAPDQIAWQRSLEDARAIAAAENRPLFVAINVDGESGSDRIVHEQYRDPEFVARTRHFVCAIGHPFRHTPRDHDDRGRRIECPRLGSVTCGEHVALEPAIFDAYLGAERVSPRHALVQSDGTKSFDLYYLFDITDLDAAVEKAARDAPPASVDESPSAEIGLLELVASRRSSDRELFEALVDSWRGEDMAPAIWPLAALSTSGNAGSIDALRLLLQGEPPPAPANLANIEETARNRGFARELALVLRDVARGAGRYPLAPTLGADRHLLPLIGRLGGAEHVSWLAAQVALCDASDRAAARSALVAACAPDVFARIDASIASAGGAVDIEDLLRLAAEFGTALPARAPAEPDPAKTMEELVSELEDAERALLGNESDPRAARRFGLANLALARALIATAGPGIGLHLQDADVWLARAALGLPDDDQLAIERARTAYNLSRFDEQARIAAGLLERVRARSVLSAEARAVLTKWPRWGSGAASGRDETERAAVLGQDGVALEALRWLGDAEGRRIGTETSEPALEAASFVRGARALATACVNVAAEDVDYQSLASYLSTLGLTRPSLATLRAGLERFPQSAVLRDLVRDVLAQCGRIDVLVATSDWLAGRNPESAACAWYAGYARVLAAEWARRGGNVEAALSAYTAAEERFRSSLELEPGYAESAGHYLAACEMGRGFALRLAYRRQDAADALVRALALRPAIGDARDGLDREALDLVDGVLEWTASGPSRVNTTAFADGLSRAVPGETRWLLAVSDTALREGLRADGRVRTRIALPRALRVEGQEETALEPSDIGDRWLSESIDLARRARSVLDDESTRRNLAQSLAVQAERELVRGLDAAAEPRILEAARILDEPAQAGESVHDVARRLRERLGDARPVARPGR